MIYFDGMYSTLCIINLGRFPEIAGPMTLCDGRLSAVVVVANRCALL